MSLVIGKCPYSAFFDLISSFCSSFFTVFEADAASDVDEVPFVGGCGAGIGVAGAATGADVDTGCCTGTVEI